MAGRNRVDWLRYGRDQTNEGSHASPVLNLFLEYARQVAQSISGEKTRAKGARHKATTRRATVSGRPLRAGRHCNVEVPDCCGYGQVWASASYWPSVTADGHARATVSLLCHLRTIQC